MTQKLSVAMLLFGLLIPASAVAPGETPEQLAQRPDGFFYFGPRSYLGVDVRDITSDRVSALKLREERGVEVTTVDQDAPAGKAGLKEHDVILEFNGVKVESEEQFRRMIRETPSGRNVSLGISRDGSPMNINVQIGDRGKIASNTWRIERSGRWPTPMPELPDFNIPFDIQVSTYTPSFGIQVDNLNQQLGEYFGVKNGEGLLVKSVEKGSPAEKAGMKAGDVIIRADNQKVTDRSDLRRILRSHPEGGKVAVGIVRDKREQNVTIELPPRKSRDSSGIEILVPDAEAFEDIESAVQEIGPAVNRTINELRPQIAYATKALTSAEFKKGMREFELQMKRLGKEFEKEQKKWRLEFDDLI